MEEKDTFHLTGPGSGRSHSALVLALALPRLNGFEGRKGLGLGLRVGKLPCLRGLVLARDSRQNSD